MAETETAVPEATTESLIYSHRAGAHFRRTGERRPPRRGEWYVSRVSGEAIHTDARTAIAFHPEDQEILERVPLPAGWVVLRRTGARFRRTGERRPPARGEWYLSIAADDPTPLRCSGDGFHTDREILEFMDGPPPKPVRPRDGWAHLSPANAGVVREAALYLTNPEFRAEAERLAAEASGGRVSAAGTLGCALAGLVKDRTFPCGTAECENQVPALRRLCDTCAPAAAEEVA